VGHNINGSFSGILTEDSQAKNKKSDLDLKKHKFAEELTDDEQGCSGSNPGGKMKSEYFSILKEEVKTTDYNHCGNIGGTGESLSNSDDDELQKLLKYEADSDEDKVSRKPPNKKFLRSC